MGNGQFGVLMSNIAMDMLACVLGMYVYISAGDILNNRSEIAVSSDMKLCQVAFLSGYAKLYPVSSK